MTLKSIDPTKIDIDFDPTIQRMKGVARHGMTPFDVPFISELDHNLWQGGCRDGLILPSFITHVVSLYPWERYEIVAEHTTRLEVEMYDSIEQSVDQVDEIARHVNEYRKKGPVLVHCQAGLNRSSLIAARALWLHEQTLDNPLSGNDIVELIRQKRSPACLCNPAFEAEVRSWT